MCSAGEGQASAVESLRSDTSWEAVEAHPAGDVTLWVPDHAATHCMGCRSAFWAGKRRHHCRLTTVWVDVKLVCNGVCFSEAVAKYFAETVRIITRRSPSSICTIRYGFVPRVTPDWGGMRTMCRIVANTTTHNRQTIILRSQLLVISNSVKNIFFDSCIILTSSVLYYSDVGFCCIQFFIVATALFFKRDNARNCEAVYCNN